jgi:hypothetical protein
MEGIARLVSESLARHGVNCSLDYRRLHWSPWFRCETSFDLLLVPTRPGLFAIAEEVIARGETALGGGKRMLAVVQVSASDDLAIGMSRLFAPNNPLKGRMASARIFARYTVIEDDVQRRSAQTAFQRWLNTSAEAASGMIHGLGDVAAFPSPTTESEPEHRPASVHPPASLPSGF